MYERANKFERSGKKKLGILFFWIKCFCIIWAFINLMLVWSLSRNMISVFIFFTVRMSITWKNIAKRTGFLYVYQKAINHTYSHNTTLPKFYHLIKTHNQSETLKIRPIVSSCNGPSRKLAWLLNKLLTKNKE